MLERLVRSLVLTGFSHPEVKIQRIELISRFKKKINVIINIKMIIYEK